MADEVIKAKVKFFNEQKGWGFLVPESGPAIGKDVFIHYSQIKTEGFKTLKENEIVECVIANGERGFAATNIVRQHE